MSKLPVIAFINLNYRSLQGEFHEMDQALFNRVRFIVVGLVKSQGWFTNFSEAPMI